MENSEVSVIKRFKRAQDRLVLQASDLSLGTIGSMVEREAIDVSPDYQRRERWSREKQAALIESFLLNVPVPPVYLSEDEYGKYSVVDGKQRITAIHAFMKDELRLHNLEEFKELEGFKLSELPTELRNALDVRPYVRVVTLLKQSDPLLKFEVFIRLNRGGELMEAQELRNVAFRGKLNDLINDLSNDEFLKKQLNIKDDRSPAYRLMRDTELILRFFTLRQNWSSFSGDFRVEMDEFMRQNLNPTSRDQKNFRSLFTKAIKNCELIWGDLAFRRHTGKTWRVQLITGMFDAQMIALDMLSEKQILVAIDKKNEVISKTQELFSDSTFDDAVRSATNTASRIKYRIEKIHEILVD